MGGYQHVCTECGAWEECAWPNGNCAQDEAGWIRGRFYCKECAEERY